MYHKFLPLLIALYIALSIIYVSAQEDNAISPPPPPHKQHTAHQNNKGKHAETEPPTIGKNISKLMGDNHTMTKRNHTHKEQTTQQLQSQTDSSKSDSKDATKHDNSNNNNTDKSGLEKAAKGVSDAAKKTKQKLSRTVEDGTGSAGFISNFFSFVMVFVSLQVIF